MQLIKLEKTPVKTVIKEVTKTLEAGGLIIFPTETTYGAGVDATNQVAVDKLLAYKSRREGKPLSIAVANQKMAEKYVKLNKQAVTLFQRFLPGPVTVVAAGRGQVARGVESEFNTLGVRIPDYQLILEILTEFGRPITATSANASGKKRPYSIEDIFNHLSIKQKKLIDLVIDAGQLAKNEPSTVIDTTLSTPTILREGTLKDKGQQSLVSNSELETKKIAGTLMLKHWSQIKDRGLVIGLNGSLGAGKTIFTKGVADFLQIKETITSPTYSYLQSYHFNRHGVEGELHHLDLWKIDQLTTLKRLNLETLIDSNNIVVIEWWSQNKSYLEKIVGQTTSKLLVITIEDLADNLRKFYLKYH